MEVIFSQGVLILVLMDNVNTGNGCNLSFNIERLNPCFNG